jgi:hypothetical protein
MDLRSLRRAATLAIAGLLTFAGTAAADSVRADGDAVTPGAQSMIDLGAVAPAAIVHAVVAFELVCSSSNHVDVGQTVTVSLAVGSAPADGAVVSASTATIGPVPAGWPADTASCPDPIPSLVGGMSTVTLQAPTITGPGQTFDLLYTRALSPAGSSDGSAIGGTFIGVSIRLDVVTNATPVVTVPADRTVEGDTIGGWSAAYPGVSASDAEDDPDPVATCEPAAGAVVPLGTTTVSCMATDSAGASGGGSFDVTVVDTIAPVLHDVPDDIEVNAADASGVTVHYGDPTAADVVDPAPDVSCAPVSGSTFPVGSTAVTCTATDQSGNHSSASFDVRVTPSSTETAVVTWHEPVGAGTTVFETNGGRTIPIKAVIMVDGEPLSTGIADVVVTPCDGGPSVVLPMDYRAGRWNTSMDTAALVGACHLVRAMVGDMDAGSFRLVLRNAQAVTSKGAGRR